MKVILVSGSPRLNGNTVQALSACAQAIEAEGLEAEIVSLAGKNIRSCIACGKCAELGRCSIDDGANEIIEKIQNAEGFVLGAPVYFGTARGDMMSFVQRLGYVAMANGRFLEGKVGGPVAVGRRGGHTATLQELLMIFAISGVTVPGSRYWNILFGRAEGEVQGDEEGLSIVRLFGQNMAQLIKKIFV